MRAITPLLPFGIKDASLSARSAPFGDFDLSPPPLAAATSRRFIIGLLRPTFTEVDCAAAAACRHEDFTTACLHDNL